MIGYYLTFGVVYTVSLLPLWMLYGFGQGLYGVLYYVFGYRRKVVEHNLTLCFPEKSKLEIRALSRQFYRHLCEVIVETIKGFSISEETLVRRVKIVNPEICEELIAEDQGAILLASHYGNFEWLTLRLDVMLARRKMPSYAIYSRLKSAAFDRLIVTLRTRWGLSLMPMRRAMINSLQRLREGCGMVGMVGDQSPNRRPQLYYTRFLGLPTAWHTSIAKVALKAEAPIIFADMKKDRKGHYSVQLIKIETDPFLPLSQINIQRLTDYHTRFLEKTILGQPAYWLWSHKRWKHPSRETDEFSPLLMHEKAD